jgi:hypothetical protein
MPNRTITKIRAFVIFAGLTPFGLTGCGFLSPEGTAQSSFADRNVPYDRPKIVGKIESGEINESSGLAASKCQPEVFWTHNDSGDDAFIFAIDAQGGSLGTWKVIGAKNIDWEDIAAFKDTAGKCFVYIGEIGNNARQRSEGTIYRVAEPQIDDSSRSSTKKNPKETAGAEILKFSYPDSRNDAETLLVHPLSGAIYVLTKRVSGPAGVYKIKPDFGSQEAQIAEKVADISVPAVPDGLLTGGDLSPDGKRVVLCDYFAGYELTLLDGAKNFDEIWKQKPLKFDIGKRENGESIAYTADGTAVIASSEKKHPPIFKMDRRVEN